MTLMDFVEFLVLAANLGVLLLIVMTVSERIRAGWNYIEQQLNEAKAQTEMLGRDLKMGDTALQEATEKVADLERQIHRANDELEEQERRHGETDLPFSYTSALIENVDLRFPSWRLIAHNADLGHKVVHLSDPAYQWNEGRLYEVPAPNYVIARATLEKLLPPQDGFFVRLLDDEDEKR